MNIYDQIHMYRTMLSDKVAIKTDSEEICYSKLLNISDNIAAFLHNLHKSSNKEGVAIVMDNSIEYIEIFLGASAANMSIYLIDPKRVSCEINAIINESDPAIVFVDNNSINKIDKDNEIVIFNINTNDDSKYNFNQFYDEVSCTRITDEVFENDVLLIGFTSGTTGKPKGYIRNHLSWYESFYLSSKIFAINENNTIIAPGPFAYSFSIFAVIHTLFVGGTFYLCKKYNPESVIDVICKEKNLVCYLVPTMIKSLLNLASQKSSLNYDSLKSIITSSAKCTFETKEEFKNVFPNSELFEYYGTSEASFISVNTIEESIKKPDSVGKKCHGVKIMLKDGDKIINDTNKVGRLYVKSNMLFDGYFINGAINKMELKDDGWFETGDYVKIDDEGYLYICGREKNMMISGGINVFPEEVEAVLMLLNEIDEVVVYGEKDEYWGDKIVALIKWRDNDLEKKTIVEHCEKYLPKYKIPQTFYKVKQFQHTISGKIIREDLMSIEKDVI